MRSGAIILLAGCLWAITANAQDTLAKPRLWSIGIGGSADHCFRTLGKNEDSEIVDFILASREDMEAPRIGFSIGIDACRDIGPHWSIASGLQFSDRGFLSVHETELIATDPNDPVLQGMSIRYEERFHYQYFSLPIMGRYRVGKGSVRFEPSLGIQADVLQGQFSLVAVAFPDGISHYDRVSDRFTDYTELGFSAIVEFGAQFRITDVWWVRCASRARYQLTPVADAPIIGHLYEIGLLLGFAVRI